MADLRLFSRPFITELIELYKSFPCLWQVNAKEYTDRTKRKAAYDALVRKYREVDKSASKEEVKRKIYGLRSSYRRELIKMKKSIRTGATLEDVYKPTLWYFYLFDFLNDQDNMVKEPTSTTDECLDDTKEEVIEYDEECDFIEHYADDLVGEDHHELDDVSSESDKDDAIDPINCDTMSEYTSVSCRSSTAPSTSQTYITAKKRKLSSANQKEDQVQIEHALKQAKEQNIPPSKPTILSSHQEDQFDVYGKLIAHKLRSFDKLQVTFSQRLINEILYEAEMGFLTRNCKVVDMGSHGQDE
ncbi:uncharacterized protein LOC126556530 [Anopheles maculipalpis]|uniref:uncharacterized protein LOC126556530 n=1 Tax=Anopheles maculipalpis TaxID=1496333 RepID=UPI0021593863|nr:uncharacterized protein LOC126556530 [Anopheles maculipalpis]